MAVPKKSVLLFDRGKFEYDVDDDVIYAGYSIPGSLTSDPVWRIAHILYDANKNITDILWANATEEYNKVWDLRLTYTYS